MIRVAKIPARVSAAFIEGVVNLAQTKLSYLKENMHYFKSREDVILTARYLQPFATRSGMATDEFITRLRKLDYEVLDYDGAVHTFYGITRPLIMSSNKRDKWDIGKYVVKVPFESIMDGVVGAITMRPYNVDTSGCYAYHPHHTENGTCWSQFIYPLSEMLKRGNLDGLFGIVLLFLQSYYPGSPLYRPPERTVPAESRHGMYWMRKLTSEEVRRLNRENYTFA